MEIRKSWPKKKTGKTMTEKTKLIHYKLLLSVIVIYIVIRITYQYLLHCISGIIVIVTKIQFFFNVFSYISSYQSSHILFVKFFNFAPFLNQINRKKKQFLQFKTNNK